MYFMLVIVPVTWEYNINKLLRVFEFDFQGGVIMYGAITGDTIGQSYECHNNKIKSLPLFSEAPLFTDDSVMIIAICGGILNTEINIERK